MIATVCMNPCIDRSVGVYDFKYGGTNRVCDVRSDAGGKGINVAVAAAQLSEEVACLSFLHAEGGKSISDKLTAFDVQCAGVSVGGALRTNLKLIDRMSGITTEVNESGAPVGTDALKQMTELILRHAQKCSLLILSGSLPRECPADYYRQIIERANELGCRCILDADGDKLREGLKARPYLVKPNIAELKELLGYTLNSLDSVKRAALSLIDMGVSIAAISMGSNGSLITDGKKCFYAPCMAVDVRSTVGAGDAMIAAFAAGCRRGLPLEEIFRMGVACASAAVMTEGTQPPEKEVYGSLLEKVCIRAL